MAGLDPAIHVFLASGTKDVDARHPPPPRLQRATTSLGRRSFSEGGKAGHDEINSWRSDCCYPAAAFIGARPH
jgi:hypothetical protein